MAKRKLGKIRHSPPGSYGLFEDWYTAVTGWLTQRTLNPPTHMTTSPTQPVQDARKAFAEAMQSYSTWNPIERSYFKRQQVEVFQFGRSGIPESNILSGLQLAISQLITTKKVTGYPYLKPETFCKQVFDPLYNGLEDAELVIISENRNRLVYWDRSDEDGLFPLGSLAPNDQPWTVALYAIGFFDHQDFSLAQLQAIAQKYYHLYHELAIWNRDLGYWIYGYEEPSIVYLPWQLTGVKYYFEDHKPVEQSDKDYDDAVMSVEPISELVFKVGVWNGSHSNFLEAFWRDVKLCDIPPANYIPERLIGYWKVTYTKRHVCTIQPW